VQFVVQTHIQEGQEKSFPGSKVAEVYSWKLTSIKCDVLGVEFYLLFANVPSQPGVTHRGNSFFKFNIPFFTSANNMHHITANEEYEWNRNEKERQNFTNKLCQRYLSHTLIHISSKLTYKQAA